MGSSAWEISLGVFRLEVFVCAPSLENFRLHASLGNFRLRSFALKQSRGNFRFGSSVWGLLLGTFRLIYSAWYVSLGIFHLVSLESFRLESFDSEFSFGIVCTLKLTIGNIGSGSFASELSHEKFDSITVAWYPSFGNLHFGTRSETSA